MSQVIQKLTEVVSDAPDTSVLRKVGIFIDFKRA